MALELIVPTFARGAHLSAYSATLQTTASTACRICMLILTFNANFVFILASHAHHKLIVCRVLRVTIYLQQEYAQIALYHVFLVIVLLDANPA